MNVRLPFSQIISDFSEKRKIRISWVRPTEVWQTDDEVSLICNASIEETVSLVSEKKNQKTLSERKKEAQFISIRAVIPNRETSHLPYPDLEVQESILDLNCGKCKRGRIFNQESEQSGPNLVIFESRGWSTSSFLRRTAHRMRHSEGGF